MVVQNILKHTKNIMALQAIQITQYDSIKTKLKSTAECGAQYNARSIRQYTALNCSLVKKLTMFTLNKLHVYNYRATSHMIFFKIVFKQKICPIRRTTTQTRYSNEPGNEWRRRYDFG